MSFKRACLSVGMLGGDLRVREGCITGSGANLSEYLCGDGVRQGYLSGGGGCAWRGSRTSGRCSVYRRPKVWAGMAKLKMCHKSILSRFVSLHKRVSSSL